MTRGDIGRVLAASLHQAITDELPTRLEFYESWLRPESLHAGRLGVAPLTAVLSFLREEDGDVYADVMELAGRYAADWTVSELAPLRRSFIQGAPIWLRRRLVLRLATELVRRACRQSRASVAWRKGVATATIRGSVFCGVRDTVPRPLCAFYEAALAGLMSAFGLPAGVTITRCRATSGEGDCLMTVHKAT